MICEKPEGLSQRQLKDALAQSLSGRRYSRVLILPPDFTRMYSGAGKLTAIYCDLLKDKAKVDVMPSLGTHVPMTKAECDSFFEGRVRHEDLIVHNWRKDVVKIGEVPSEFVSEVSDGLVTDKIDVEVNRRIVSGDYDLIISIGQVVPHEVVGMANYSKNIFVGCGGASMINSSHMLGAFYGMERVMGKDFSPVRKVFDYAEEHFLKDLPILYVLTVTTNSCGEVKIHGLYIGRDRKNFEKAVNLSQSYNIIQLDKPIKKAVAFVDGREFKSTWIGNKAIYRTRMAMADGGELIVLAPGVDKCGEDPENDRLIKKYGYIGRENVLYLVKENADLRENLSVAAHLIHGSSDGRFNITYAAPKLGEETIEAIYYKYADLAELMKKYNPAVLKDGWNTVDGEEIFFISNPALGLWGLKQ